LSIGDFLGAVEMRGHADNASIDYLEVFAECNLQVLTDTETSLQYIKANNIHSGTTDLVTYDDDDSGSLQAATPYLQAERRALAQALKEAKVINKALI
jgi:hypothetical protein